MYKIKTTDLFLNFRLYRGVTRGFMSAFAQILEEGMTRTFIKKNQFFQNKGLFLIEFPTKKPANYSGDPGTLNFSVSFL